MSPRKLSGSHTSSPRPKKRAKTSAAADVRDKQDGIAIKLSQLDAKSADPIVLQTRERLTAQWNELKQKLPALEKSLLEEENEERSSNSLSPSQLQLRAENLDRARGAFQIHDRDSGIARHPFFYTVVQYINNGGAQGDSLLGMGNQETAESLRNVPEKEWGWLVASIHQLARENSVHSTESKDIRGREAFYSEGLARCLAKFSFRNKLAFLFSHQLACKATSNKEDTADVAVFYAERGGYDPLLGLIEVKKSSHDMAKWQLCDYLSEAFESELMDGDQRISIGLTIDQNCVGLYGFRWEGQGNSHNRPLLEHSLLWSASLMEAGTVFKAYFHCLAALSDPKVREAPATNDYCPLVDHQVIYNSPKVFHNKEKTTMYKLFDYGKCRMKKRQPNKDVVETAYSKIENCPVGLQEDSGSMVSVLTTPWFKGNHEPRCPEHVAKLCDQLQQLHDKDMRHNDVLCQNIVFGFDGDGPKSNPTTHLIDFDFAHIRLSRVLEYQVPGTTPQVP